MPIATYHGAAIASISGTPQSGLSLPSQAARRSRTRDLGRSCHDHQRNWPFKRTPMPSAIRTKLPTMSILCSLTRHVHFARLAAQEHREAQGCVDLRKVCFDAKQAACDQRPAQRPVSDRTKGRYPPREKHDADRGKPRGQAVRPDFSGAYVPEHRNARGLQPVNSCGLQVMGRVLISDVDEVPLSSICRLACAKRGSSRSIGGMLATGQEHQQSQGKQQQCPRRDANATPTW